MGLKICLAGDRGTKKKNAAISFARMSLSMASAIENRKIVDEAGFKSGLSIVINAPVWAKKASAVRSTHDGSDFSIPLLRSNLPASF